MFDGPRIVASGSCIGSTGGHADSHYSPYLKTVYDIIDGLVVDGPDQAMRAARYVIKYGADVVKFMATGGVTTMGTTVGAQQLTFEEMRAMCQVAEMYGVTSSTHAHGTGGIKTAVKAGVTSIEHGTMMDDECVGADGGERHVPDAYHHRVQTYDGARRGGGHSASRNGESQEGRPVSPGELPEVSGGRESPSYSERTADRPAIPTDSSTTSLNSSVRWA